jgi:DNA-binding transcriptional ArsR family regulator
MSAAAELCRVHDGAMTLAQVAALLADATRAAFCLALLDGRAWTAGELARHAGVTPPTASEHLTRLVAGGLLTEERQGRHRYLRLASPAAAALIEDLSSFRPDERAPGSLRESVRLSAEARARTCYDHLAGQLGVAVTDALLDRGLLADGAGLAITPDGVRWLAGLDVEVAALKGSRPLVRTCLDWTERRAHLAGAVGAALCRTALDRRWVERIGSGRALRVTPAGRRALHDLLDLELEVGASHASGRRPG